MERALIGYPMTTPRALALAVMALGDVATRYPDDRDWGTAQEMVRDLKERIMEQEPELAYQAALQLVRHIDQDLAQGRRHYRTRSGRLLVHLDQVVEAILRGELA